MKKISNVTVPDKLGTKKDELSCSFCGKASDKVTKLLTGTDGNICDECVRVSVEAIRDDGNETNFKFAYQLLDWHFGSLRRENIITTTRTFPAHVRVDLQLAVEAMFKEWKPLRHVGVYCEYSYTELSIPKLMENRQHSEYVAPLQYEDIDIGEAELIKCLKNGLWLFDREGVRYAIFLTKRQEMHTGGFIVNVELAAPAGEEGRNISERFFRNLEQAVNQSKSYRGKVLSFEVSSRYRGTSSGITVHKLRQVKKDEIILPAQTVNLIERNIISFAKKRAQLKGMKLSGKKGVLFYGPPGTGKTHTLHYLAGHLPDHTTLLVTAEQMGLIKEYFMLARLLQPAILVIEDVDLIARSRESMNSPCEESLLNTLLNEMDGLKEDAEIFFILTTNRPETLEQALAARPGRIDQAIEFPLPDRAGREKLIKLYSPNMKLSKDLIKSISERTEGVSASFIKELMRRASQYFLDDQKGDGINNKHIDDALQEMLFSGGKLNIKLLGGNEQQT